MNFGVESYNAAQESLRFGRALSELGDGAERPDLAVFYDGANGLATAVERVEVGRTDPDETYFQAVSNAERAARGTSRRTAAMTGTERAELAVELGAAQYRRAVRLSDDLGRGAGVHTVHLWQPLLATTPRRVFEGPLLAELHTDDTALDRVRTMYEDMRVSSRVDPVDLSDALAGATGPTFFDFEHTNERGAALIAEHVYHAIRPLLLARMAGR
ncbi:MAG: hypothetical protein R2698_08575 [Microthrixaceae bacterium]